MTQKTIIYCAANVAHADGPILSIGLALADATWRYIEIIDVEHELLDETIRAHVLPRMKRVPSTHFLKSVDLVGDLAEFLGPYTKKGAVECRVLGAPGPQVQACLVQAAGSMAIEVTGVAVDEALFSQYQRHCGGSDRVRDHALADAIGAALCDRSRDERAHFHEASIAHLELLLGSKNATSFRAWARALEREREREQARGSEQVRQAA